MNRVDQRKAKHMNRTFEEWSKVKASAVTAGSVAQATNVLQMALDDIAHIQRMLRDPQAVHANMLRGVIAVPSEEQIAHIRGVDYDLAMLDHPGAGGKSYR